MDETCDNCGTEVDGFAYMNQNGMCTQCWTNAYEDLDDDDDDSRDDCEDDDDEEDDRLDDCEDDDDDEPTDQCPECGEEVGQSEIELNQGTCGECADTVDEEEDEE